MKIKTCFLALAMFFVLASPLKGEVRTSGVTEYLIGNIDSDWWHRGRFYLEIDWKPESRKWKIHLYPRFQADNIGARGALDWGDDRHDRIFDFPGGSYIEYEASDLLGFRFGWLGLNWMVGEERSPIDFVPQSYIKAVENERRTLLSFETYVNLTKNLYFNTVASKSSMSIFPWDDENWYLPPELNGVIVKKLPLKNRPQVSTRLGFSWRGVDFSLLHHYGWDAPRFEMVSSGILETDYFRTNMGGANISLKVPRLCVIKGEVAYWDQEGDQDDYLSWLVGINKNFSLGDHHFSIFLQYLRENVVNNGPNPFQDLDLSREPKNSLMLKIIYEFWDWEVSIRGACDFEETGWYVQSKLSRRFDLDRNNVLEISGIYDWIEGSRNSAIGRYDENDAVFLLVALYFNLPF